MRVAFDATPIPGRRVGAGVYTTELLRALDVQQIELEVFANARDVEELRVIAPRATIHPVSVPTRPLRIAWAHVILPVLANRLRADVFHGPHYTLPGRLRMPAAVTFHDPTFFTYPELHERAKVVYFTRAAQHGIKRAARTLAVSEYARRGAVEHAGADPDRVDVVYEGVDTERYRPPAERTTDDPYLLFVGAIEPRKDVPTLVAAHRELVARGFPHRLVLCGPPAWGAADVDAAVAEAAAGTVERTGYVSEERKIGLYQQAAALVYPSIAEGFGLPVLEAMACGTPVVTTTGSAPEEIAGGCALLVPPRDPSALRDAIARVVSDDELAAELRRRGVERAREFTWHRAAAETISTWRRALER